MSDTTQNSGDNSGKGRGRPQNLTPWQPGRSGNPGGRPKRKPITDAYNELMAAVDPNTGLTGAQTLALAAFRRAIVDGNAVLVKEITDRVEGTVKQALDILFGDMSNDDLADYIAGLAATASAGTHGSEAAGDGPGDDTEAAPGDGEGTGAE